MVELLFTEDFFFNTEQLTIEYINFSFWATLSKYDCCFLLCRSWCIMLYWAVSWDSLVSARRVPRRAALLYDPSSNISRTYVTLSNNNIHYYCGLIRLHSNSTDVCHVFFPINLPFPINYTETQQNSTAN